MALISNFYGESYTAVEGKVGAWARSEDSRRNSRYNEHHLLSARAVRRPHALLLTRMYHLHIRPIIRV